MGGTRVDQVFEIPANTWTRVLWIAYFPSLTYNINVGETIVQYRYVTAYLGFPWVSTGSFSGIKSFGSNWYNPVVGVYLNPPRQIRIEITR